MSKDYIVSLTHPSIACLEVALNRRDGNYSLINFDAEDYKKGDVEELISFLTFAIKTFEGIK